MGNAKVEPTLIFKSEDVSPTGDEGNIRPMSYMTTLVIKNPKGSLRLELVDVPVGTTVSIPLSQANDFPKLLRTIDLADCEATVCLIANTSVDPKITAVVKLRYQHDRFRFVGEIWNTSVDCPVNSSLRMFQYAHETGVDALAELGPLL